MIDGSKLILVKVLQRFGTNIHNGNVIRRGEGIIFPTLGCHGIQWRGIVITSNSIEEEEEDITNHDDSDTATTTLGMGGTKTDIRVKMVGTVGGKGRFRIAITATVFQKTKSWTNSGDAKRGT